MTEPLPLDAHQRLRLIAALGEDRPETVSTIYALMNDRGRAYVEWDNSGGLKAAVVQPDLCPDEPLAYGEPEAIWRLAKQIPDWRVIEVDDATAERLAAIIRADTGNPATLYRDFHYTLTFPPANFKHADVRLLTRDDLDLYAASAEAFGDDPEQARRHLLEGPIAAGIVDGRVVSVVEGNVRTKRFANLTADTLPEFRNRGLVTAAACLAARAVQSMGITPVWSTGETNFASQRVAEKLGFQRVGQLTYVCPTAR